MIEDLYRVDGGESLPDLFSTVGSVFPTLEFYTIDLEVQRISGVGEFL